MSLHWKKIATFVFKSINKIGPILTNDILSLGHIHEPVILFGPVWIVIVATILEMPQDLSLTQGQREWMEACCQHH